MSITEKLEVPRMQKGQLPLHYHYITHIHHYSFLNTVPCRPPIVHWKNENDALPTVYGGHDSVTSNDRNNLDSLGPPVELNNAAKTDMDKDLTTRGQMLVQELEDTSWSEADDSPNSH